MGFQVDTTVLRQARSKLACHHGTADMQQCSPCGEQLYDYYGNPVMAQPWTTKGQRSSRKGQSKGGSKGKGKGLDQKGAGKGGMGREEWVV